jgi:lipoyl(octanoyl) transferase
MPDSCFSPQVPVLDTLLFFPDATPRSGPAQMALDEALLEASPGPVLRTYTWTGPWISFGYSQSLAEIVEAFPAQNLVRRWTGGGIVPHRPDWTFSLVLPRDLPLARLRPSESYCAVHKAVATALQQIEVSTALALDQPPGKTEACFAGPPAQHDVLSSEGAKLCGGAQRRTRQGFLHQGSLQHVPVPIDFGEGLGRALSGELKEFTPSADLLARAEELTQKKYSTPDWASRIP